MKCHEMIASYPTHVSGLSFLVQLWNTIHDGSQDVCYVERIYFHDYGL